MKRVSFSRQRLHSTTAQSHERYWCIAEQSCQTARLAEIIVPFWFYMPFMELIHILVNTNCLLLLYRVYPQLCYPLDCFPSILILLATFFCHKELHEAWIYEMITQHNRIRARRGKKTNWLLTSCMWTAGSTSGSSYPAITSVLSDHTAWNGSLNVLKTHPITQTTFGGDRVTEGPPTQLMCSVSKHRGGGGGDLIPHVNQTIMSLFH